MSYQIMKILGGNLNAYYKAEDTSPKGYILDDSNHMTFWKRKNYGVKSKKFSACQGLDGRKDELVEHRVFLGQ